MPTYPQVTANEVDRLPGMVCWCDPKIPGQSTGWNGAAWFTRQVMPRSGILHDLAIIIGSVSAGNVRMALYDTGDASPGNYTRLWDSGTVAAGSAGSPQIVGDPAYPVYAGQQLEFGVQVDTGSLELLAPPAAWDGQLPANYLPCKGGALPKMASSIAQAFGAFPASIAEAAMLNVGPGSTMFTMGRIA